MKNKKNIGNEKLKAARSLNKITQKELAEMTGLTQTTITKIERGETVNPSIDVAIKIANALKENVYNLFGDESSLMNSISDKLSLDATYQINELKAENIKLKEQLEIKNRESLLYVNINERIENENKTLKEHLITWPELYLHGFHSELRNDLKEDRINEEEAVKLTKDVYGIVAKAFLFSVTFKKEYIDTLEKTLRKKYKTIYDYEFEPFIKLVREIQNDFESFEE